MPSLGEVGATLHQVVDTTTRAQASLSQAADLAAEAADMIEIAGAGSNQADVLITSAAFREVAYDADQAVGRDLDAALQTVYRIIKSLGVVVPAKPLLEPTPSSTPTSPPLTDEERIAEIRRELPEPRRPAAGTKTNGRWFTARGPVRAQVSGDGPDARMVHDALREEGYPHSGAPIVTTHVEMKIAGQMRRDGIREATLVIDNVPCAKLLGCENLIGVVLPAGYSLTVHGTGGYRRTFKGGQKPPWRR
ncbi:DddA-like double-stranded DNA deaminase toxin [Actinosynnema sp. NPDC047251]|uniref:SCP1.201-like deaminase n=1 Tax=Saccharothrix espanaensis (strain ATCC 51144 / DSM 44229 / JCM 9112 / NBRC 15066 / NRRL 15764) TaxID=1179773 RepID=K0JXG5_SACES|nr:DddA-like double-stranded DNA deaminase toxin [Saccharothrix espanaensis]CCH28933.1 hypothetical protein BN6_16100 [Saccharothrix espanaensis DSM 44229]